MRTQTSARSAAHSHAHSLSRSSPRSVAAFSAFALLTLAAGLAGAQPAQQTGGQPASPAAPKAIPRAQLPTDFDPDEPPLNDYLTYSEPQHWTARVQVDVTAFEVVNRNQLEVQNWNMDTLALVFPAIQETSSATGDLSKITGELRVADRVFTKDYSIIRGYHSGAVYTRWDAANLRGIREVTLIYEPRVNCWETQLDEAAAASVGWPQGDYPSDARSTFEPQYGVDYTELEPDAAERIPQLVNRWTEGRDPKSIPPLQLAKYFAGRVVELVQPAAPGLQRGRTPQRRGFEGFRVLGPDRTVRAGRGSPFDIACLLAAVYREAGLPARVVVGLREFDDFDTDDLNRVELQGIDALHAYVEFFLYDEATGNQGWIPVDPVMIRKQSSRAKPLNQPWEFFGTHDELDHFIPLSFHFHPPTTVRAYGSPGFWGWFVTPSSPATAFQQLTFATYNTPVRGGD